MAISRCNKCGTATEHDKAHIETRQNCIKCGTPTLVYDTIFFINKLSTLYFTQQKELSALRDSVVSVTNTTIEPSTRPTLEFDVHNSNILSSEAQHAPVIAWFKSKNITAVVSPSAVDTTGFFDEAAITIGSDYVLLSEVCERVRYAQKKEHNSTLIQLDKKSKDEANALERFIMQLYEHSLFARYIHNKKESNIRVVLQNAPSVRKFFEGDWLEWYALMIGLRLFQEKGIQFHCARNTILSLPNDEKRELDVFFLINENLPIYIECKTGEFRQELDKYVALRKRLGIGQKYFILCIAGLDLEQAKGLSAMYEMTFVNTEALAPHLLTLI